MNNKNNPIVYDEKFNSNNDYDGDGIINGKEFDYLGSENEFAMLKSVGMTDKAFHKTR